jgi:hypothetical protein
VVILKALVLAVARHAQASRHSAIADSQMAPISKVLARSQTGLEKRSTNSTISGDNSTGSVGIRKTPFGEEIFRSLRGLPLLFQRPGMDIAFMNLVTPPAMKIGSGRRMMTPSSVTEGRSRLGVINPG